MSGDCVITYEWLCCLPVVHGCIATVIIFLLLYYRCYFILLAGCMGRLKREFFMCAMTVADRYSCGYTLDL